VSTPSNRRAAPDPEIVAAFELASDSLTAIATGHINATWLAHNARGQALILQRVNPIFAPQVNRDIDVVTRHLQSKGIVTPLLAPAPGGELWLERAGAVWRTLHYIPGITHETVKHAARASEAGRTLAEFHLGLADLQHEFENVRLGVHDTDRHLAALAAALREHDEHAQFAPISALGAQIAALAATREALPSAPDRIVHGDPKISNVIFDAHSDAAICLIDLDTLGKMPVALELGDALRSWCNPSAEDAEDAGFSSELYEAAIRGYGDVACGWLQAAEWCAIPAAAFTITVELAARFCADALHERYFGWDPERFASASEHHQARARGQLAVARAIRAAMPELHAITRRHFGSA
jgi:Ser/Thr protein kinase RdoA (MazF antagonist)